jgi:hypothetical protein
MKPRDWIIVESVLALVLFLLWLAPWIEMPGSGTVYGYELPPALRSLDSLSQALNGNQTPRFNPFLLIYLLPVFCVATLLHEAFRIDPTLLASCAGTVPVASIAYAFGVVGSDIVPLLHPAAYVALGFSMLIVLVSAFSDRDGDRLPARNYAALAIFLLAVPICGVVGYANR